MAEPTADKLVAIYIKMRNAIKEKEDGLVPGCPDCQSFETQQVITAGILLGQATTGNDRSLPSARCGPGTGSGCCG